MDKYLKPAKLDADPGDSVESASNYKHWKKTFDSFLETFTDPAPTDANQLAMLTNHVSHSVFKYISGCETYATAIQKLNNIYITPQNEIYSRHLLLSRKQKDGESVDQYMSALDLLSKECVFADITANVYRDEYIRDSFICGLKSTEIRQRLLEDCSDRTTTFKRARTLELSVKQSQQIGNSTIVNAMTSENEQNEAISAALHGRPSHGASPGLYRAPTRDMPYNYNNAARGNSSSNSSKSCFYCGFSLHPRSKCPAREAFCHTCGIKGHFQKVCRNPSLSGKRNDNRTNSTSAVLHGDTQSRAAAIIPTSLSDAIVSAKVSGSDVNVLIDSGSTESYINENIVNDLGLKVCYNDRKTVRMASEAQVIVTIGSTSVELNLAGHIYENVKLSVMPNLCTDVIIGHDVLSQHEKLVINFGGHRSSMLIDKISESGFACSLSQIRISPQPLFHNLSSDVKPIACKSRRYGTSEQQFIESSTANLLSDGVIEPSSSPWRAQVLVTTNDRHKRRMVVDYSHTINKYTELDAYPLPNLDTLAQKVAKYAVYSTYDLKSAYHQVPICESDKPYTAFESGGRLYQFTRIPFGVTNGVAAFQRVLDTIIDTEQLIATYAYLDNITVCGENQEKHDRNVEKFMEIVEKYKFTLNNDKTIKSVTEIKILGYLISKDKTCPDPDRMKPLFDLPVPQNQKSLKRALGLFSYYSKWVSKFSDKIRSLTGEPNFPLNEEAISAFNTMKKSIAESCLICPNNDDLLVLETDASDHCLSASLNQGGRPVAFFSRTLHSHEQHHHSVEKEACAIVEAARKWRHYLCGRRFLLLTDQEAVSYIFNKTSHGKTKNNKILRWRIELSCLDFDIKFRPGKNNVTADCLSRAFCSSMYRDEDLLDLHNGLCHPGITRMNHFVRTKNLPYSLEDVKRVTSQCTICARLKPNYYKPDNPALIKSTQPLERISIDFKGPLPSVSKNKYILTIVDEYSRFPFAYPCKNIDTGTVKQCLSEFFALFGTPGYIHSDRGRSFISENLREFLISQGIGSSFSAAYNPRGNGQCERYNGTIWKTVQLALENKKLDRSQWEIVLPEALHAIRSLLCTATNTTPHERFLGFSRRSATGKTLPTWLLEQGKALLRRHVRPSKYDPLGDEVDIVDINPHYAKVQMPNNYVKTVSLRDLAPLPKTRNENNNISESILNEVAAPVATPYPPSALYTPTVPSVASAPNRSLDTCPSSVTAPRRSARETKPPDVTNYSKLGG